MVRREGPATGGAVSDQLQIDLLAGEAPTFTCCQALVPLDRQARPSDHAPGCSNPNLAMFDENGDPKRLLWCSDTARKGGPCPYVGERARFRPAGGCCKDLAVERAGRALEDSAY